MSDDAFKSVLKTFARNLAFLKMLGCARTEWKTLTGMTIRYPNGTHEFDSWLETRYGLKRADTIQAVAFSAYDVIDPQKYSLFLLKFSNEKYHS